MNPAQVLAEKMEEKTDRQLLDMFARQSDWTPEALNAARTELQKRNIHIPEITHQSWAERSPATVNRPKESPLASLSLAIPCIALVIALCTVSGAGSGTGGDMIGWAFFVWAGLGLGVGGLIGITLAVTSIVRKEGGFGRQLAGLLLNFVCLVPGGMIAQLWLER